MLLALVAPLVLAACDGNPHPSNGVPHTPVWSALTASTVVPRGSVWRYLDTGADPGPGWVQAGFDDGAWSAGAAPLGYGDGDENTVIGFGPDSARKHMTTYFRRGFTVTNASGYRTLELRVQRDDGAVVFLNGVEVFRTNMPSGPIGPTTAAASTTNDETGYQVAKLDPALLREGTNLLAVEIHQSFATSSDLSFDAELVGEWTGATPPAPETGTEVLVSARTSWRYLDDGTDAGTAWRATSFDDSRWKAGLGPLGYGDGDEATVVGYGPSATQKFMTTYFRRSFSLTSTAGIRQLTLRVQRDDGAIAYLNGVEVFRTNMPSGAVTASTPAASTTNDETSYLPVSVDPALLRAGSNVLAVEVHQSFATSSDLSFDAELVATREGGPPPPAGPRRRVESYVANYGPWNATSIAIAKRHDLVIAHPLYGRLTRALVADIQSGLSATDPSDDVLVLCYISVGEDLRSASVTDEEARRDPRFIGNGTGPRIDPRGPDADGKSLAGIDPRGLPSNGGTGYASFYLDDNSVDRSPTGVGDGIPDRNPIFGSYFVNAGDPAWFDVVDGMTLDGPDRLPGLREILTTTTGRGLGCDGVFLDTLDTAAPNHFTNANSFNQTEFEWTAPGFASFVRHIRAAYPDKLIMQNRGLFFFDPRHPHYQFTTRGAIDFALFESYRLHSGTQEEWHPYFFPDNRYNIAPKLMAEANRSDGFQVLSLGYAEGPPSTMSSETLLGRSSLGFASLLEDIRVTQELAGFRHHLTNARIDLANSFVLDHANFGDAAAPFWTSTYNDRQPGWPNPPGEPTPRVGVREVIPGPRQLTVRWDVAMDMNPVGYAAYYQTSPFDFTADPSLRAATRVELSPAVPPSYPGAGGTAGTLASEGVLPGLVPGQTYYVIVRAFDRTPSRREDANRIVLSGAPTP